MRPDPTAKTPPPEVKMRAVPLFRHSGQLLGADKRQVGGANPKDTLVLGQEPVTVSYIAKSPRLWPRECVTEAILSTIAKTFPLSVARFRLVRLPSATTADDLRFMSEVFLKPQEALVHGVEIAARWLETDPDEMGRVFELEDKTQEREFYSVEMIVDMLRAIGRDELERRRLVTDFGKMVMFDAFVGVQDRHAQNWGVVECTTDPTRMLRFAPIYDTARGLFVSHDEKKLAALDNDQRQDTIARYAERSKPIFGCRGKGGSTVNHFQLVQHLIAHLPGHFRSCARQIVSAIDLPRIYKDVRIRYARIVTPRRLRFIEQLLEYRAHRMRGIVFPPTDRADL